MAGNSRHHAPPVDEPTHKHKEHKSKVNGSNEEDDDMAKCVVRWPFLIEDDPEGLYIQANAGDVVMLTAEKKYVRAYDRRLPIVKKVRKGGSSSSSYTVCSDGGLISPWYLIPKSVWLKPDKIACGRWFVGVMTPLEASFHLEREECHRALQNHVIVCQPPDFDRRQIVAEGGVGSSSEVAVDSPEWPELLLLVRMYRGTESANNRRWVTAKQRLFDRITGAGRSPMPCILYAIIRRDENGFYYIYPETTNVYPTVDTLIGTLVESSDVLALDADYKPREMQVFEAVEESRVNVPAPPCMPSFACHLSHTPAHTPLLIKLAEDTKVDLVTVSNVARHRHGFFAMLAVESLAKYVDKQGKARTSTVFVKALNEKFLAMSFVDEAFSAIRNLRVHSTRGINYLLPYYTLMDKKMSAGTRHMLVQEFAQSSLYDALKQRRKSSQRLYIRPMCEVLYQIAMGMVFLEQHNMPHRNLSTRNVMVVRETAYALRIKLSDWSVPAAVLDDPAVRRHNVPIDKLPWRWWPPEMLRDVTAKTSIKADVFAYGVLIYEVITHGCRPYSSESSGTKCEKAAELSALFANNGRLECPTLMPPWLYNMQMWCWVDDPDKRVTFARITRFFTELLYDGICGPNRAILRWRTPDCVRDTIEGAKAYNKSHSTMSVAGGRASKGGKKAKQKTGDVSPIVDEHSGVVDASESGGGGGD